jgi:hypothetical protein
MRSLYLPRRDRRLTREEQEQPNHEEGRHEDRAAQSPSGRRQPQLEPATTGHLEPIEARLQSLVTHPHIRTYVPRLINTGRVLYLHQARQAGRIWYKPPYHEAIGDERQHSDR